MREEVILSVTVMAHPRRRERASQLAARLQRFGATVAYDPEPDATPSAMRTAKLAWGSFNAAATHHMVIQEDAMLPQNFAATVLKAISLQPNRLLSLCSDWTTRTGQAVRIAARQGRNWAPLCDLSVWAPAVVMPTAMVKGFINYLPSHPDDRDSVALLRYLELSGQFGLAPVPNLVQHDVPVSPSMWGRNIDQGVRRSALFVDELEPDFFQNSDVAEFEVLPYIPLDRLMTTIGTPGPYGMYQLRPGVEWFGERGYTRDVLAAIFAETVDRALYAPLLEFVSAALLFQIWQTAFALGISSSVAPAHAMSPLLIHTANSTLLAGAMKRVFPVETIELVQSLLDSRWIDLGFRAGCEHRPRRALLAAM